jgi:phosphosulfolactate phosphohydrolase-like enzyme
MNIRFVDVEGARQIRGGVVVVIDVMRAYTVAAWAFHLGASELILVDDVEQAVAVAAEIPESLLCKDGAPDARFHLHNSPRLEADEDLACAEYIAELVDGGKPDARAFLNRAFVSAAANDLREGVAKGFRGVSEHDVAMCLELDKFHFVMQAKRTGGQLRLRATEP